MGQELGGFRGGHTDHDVKFAQKRQIERERYPII
jgi:hypothetical protein